MTELTLPLLRPTLPGRVEGYVCDNPPTVQCQECGAEFTHRHIGVLITTSGCQFHHGGWPDGTNPRLCRDCRLARGCHCATCDSSRRSYGGKR